MASRRGNYNVRTRKAIAKQSANLRMNALYGYIKGIKRNILADYTNFLTKLDTKSNFVKYANNIVHKSRQWNAIRKKHVTASSFKKLLNWRRKSTYIFKSIYRYVSEDYKSRGDIVEDEILDMLEEQGFELKYRNQVWIHKYIPWISCTTDAVIVSDSVVKIAVEVKSYTSENRFRQSFVVNGSELTLKTNSSVHYQIQMIAEVVDVPYVLLMVEFNKHVHRIIIHRDLDFLWERFEKIKNVYLSYIVPFNLYGVPDETAVDSNGELAYFGRYTYNKLLKLLGKKTCEIFAGSEVSMLEYPNIYRPSDEKGEYFDFNTDELLMDRISAFELHEFLISRVQ